MKATRGREMLVLAFVATGTLLITIEILSNIISFLI